MNTSLYNRYIAAKIAKTHNDPYFFKWNPNSPKEIFDPLSDSNIRINRVYASPAVILFFYPFSALKFSTLKMIWMLLEWLFIILAILLLANSSNIDANKRMIFAILLLIFPNSYFWTTHLIKGAFFIFFIFGVALYIFLYKKRREYKIFSSFLLGFISLFYPASMVFALFVFARKKFSEISFFISGCLLNFIVTSLILGKNIWFSYLKMLQIHILEKIPYQLPIEMQFKSDLADLLKEKLLYIMNDRKLYDFTLYFQDKTIFYLLLSAILLIFIYLFYKSKTFERRFFFTLLTMIFLQIIMPVPFYLYHNLIFMPIIALYIIDVKTV